MYDELILKLREDAEFLKIASKYNDTKNEFAERISQAADAIEELSKGRKKGEWELNAPDDFIVYCSECMMPQDSPCNFCPNCGAEMLPTQMSET